MTWRVIALRVASRVRTAMAFPDLDLSDPTRGMCGPATLTEATARPDSALQSKRKALIDQVSENRKRHARNRATCSALRDVTTECLRRGV